MNRIYLDHTATTPLDPDVFAAMKPWFLDLFGNASSVHSFGQAAKAGLDESRDHIAGIIGAAAGEVIFVSGGTEANNLALKGMVWAAPASKRQIITTNAEHHAVLDTCGWLQSAGCEVTLLPVDKEGMIDPARIKHAVTDRTALVSVMLVNNEVGTLNPVREISSLLKPLGIPLHCDAVQALGKVHVNVDDLGVDLLTISAHKIYGPKGIGALYVRKGISPDRLLHGGGQERGRRAGTESVPLAVGFARAAVMAEEMREIESVRMENLRAGFLTDLARRFPFLLVNGAPASRVPHIVSVSFDSSRILIDGEALLFNLDLAGVAVTSGSACTSGSTEPSHVLLAMGRDPATARASLRISMGRGTTAGDLRSAADRLEEIVRRIGQTRT